MSICNFDLIESLLEFKKEHDFYFIQVIQRKKDHKDSKFPLASNNNNRTIRTYNVFSIAQLRKYEIEIKEMCKLFNARAGISLNVRNAKDLSFEMMQLLAQNIKSNHFNQLGGLWNTVCGQHHSDKDKKWILDIDHKMETDVSEFIKTQNPIGDKFIALIPSRQGYHLIVKPFDAREFGMKYPDIEIHKNNPTNLFIP